MFSPAYVWPAAVYSNFCRPTLRPISPKICWSFSTTLSHHLNFSYGPQRKAIEWMRAILRGVLPGQVFHFMSVGPEHVLLAAAKVRVHLAGQQRVLGDVRVPGVAVQWEQEKPYDADCDAEEGQVRWELQESRIASEGEDCLGWELLATA